MSTLAFSLLLRVDLPFKAQGPWQTLRHVRALLEDTIPRKHDDPHANGYRERGNKESAQKIIERHTRVLGAKPRCFDCKEVWVLKNVQ